MADILSKDELDALLTQMQDGGDEEADAAEGSNEVDAQGGADEDEAPAGGLDLTTSVPAGVNRGNLEMILNIPVHARVELGRARLPIGEILSLCQGSVVELNNLASEMIDLTVNDRIVAHGEAVVVNENFGLRILEVESVADRIRKL